mmetsp:Transcript_16692/g.49947  ORF Transcript_16692/g.49947 Transcript_16692/m.49947 type:complete len:220 (+) Transcript_16692:336-995(+)
MSGPSPCSTLQLLVPSCTPLSASHSHPHSTTTPRQSLLDSQKKHTAERIFDAKVLCISWFTCRRFLLCMCRRRPLCEPLVYLSKLNPKSPSPMRLCANTGKACCRRKRTLEMIYLAGLLMSSALALPPLLVHFLSTLHQEENPSTNSTGARGMQLCADARPAEFFFQILASNCWPSCSDRIAERNQTQADIITKRVSRSRNKAGGLAGHPYTATKRPPP